MFDCSSKKAYLLAPVVFAACVLALLVTWAVMEPAALRHAFDQDGYSVFELATIPFYAAIIPFVWWKCPFTGSRRRRMLLCAAVSCVAFMAVAKELDWHLAVMKHLFPSIVGADGKSGQSVNLSTKTLTNQPDYTYRAYLAEILGVDTSEIPATANSDSADLITQIETAMDRRNSINQQTMIELQSATSKRDQAYDMISNILKSLNNVMLGIVNNT